MTPKWEILTVELLPEQPLRIFLRIGFVLSAA